MVIVDNKITIPSEDFEPKSWLLPYMTKKAIQVMEITYYAGNINEPMSGLAMVSY